MPLGKTSCTLAWGLCFYIYIDIDDWLIDIDVMAYPPCNTHAATLVKPYIMFRCTWGDGRESKKDKGKERVRER